MRSDPGVPGRGVRRGVYCFLAAFAIAGLAHLELYPFSAFRLFSELRPAERQSWQLRAVTADAGEQPIRLGDLPIAYRNSTRLLLDFPDLSKRQRDAICDAWAQPLRDAGELVDAIRVYAVVESVRPHGPPPQRRLAFQCGTMR